MKCPSCKSQAVTFIEWCGGSKAFKTECNNCHIDLKANIMTYLTFIITLLISIGVIPYLEDIYMLLNIEAPHKEFRILFILPFIILGVIIGWISGGYRINKKERP